MSAWFVSLQQKTLDIGSTSAVSIDVVDKSIFPTRMASHYADHPASVRGIASEPPQVPIRLAVLTVPLV